MTPHAMWGMAFVRNTLPSSGLSKTTLQQNRRWLPHAYKSRCDERVIYTIVHPVHSPQSGNWHPKDDWQHQSL